MNIIKLKELAGSDCLWGASLANQHLLTIWNKVKSSARASASSNHVVLDFKDIQAANVSYIKGTFLWLLQNGMSYAKRKVSPPLPESTIAPPSLDITPFIANPNTEILAEVDEVLSRHGLPYLVALEYSSEEVLSATVSANLDDILMRTLLYISEEGGAMASQLHAKYEDEGISVTGWNNRMAELFELRLLSRSKSGRSLIYKSIVKEIRHG